MENPKIYNPVVVIGQSNVGGIPSKITCLECCNSRLFVGTFDGELVEYFITEDEGLYSKVRTLPVGKGQPIVYVRSASALDSLLVLCGGTLSLYDLDTLEIKGNNNVGNVTAVAVDENPTSADPFIVELCFSRKSSVIICHVSSEGFQLLSDISVDSLAISLSVDSGLICAALAVGHYVMVNGSVGKRSTQRLCDFDARETRPKVVHVKKEEFLVLGPGSLGVFVSSSGTSERPPIVWRNKVHQVVVHNSNIVAVGQDTIHVHSLLDANYSTTIPFPGAKSVQVIEGNLYAWTGSSLYRFQTITVEEQVEALLGAGNFQSAFTLLRNAGNEKYPLLLQKVHRKAVFRYLACGDLDSAKYSIEEGSLDMREIIRLYPGILPEDSTFIPSLPPFHQVGTMEQLCGDNLTLVQKVTELLIEMLVESNNTIGNRDLCTSLIKLAGMYDTNSFSLLVKKAPEMNLHVESVMNFYDIHKLKPMSGALLRELGKTETSLEIYMGLCTDESGENEQQLAASAVTDILSECQDEDILWKYFYKFLKVHPDLAKQVFKKRSGVRGPSNTVVAEKLYAFPELCMDYLEFLIFEKENQDSDIHTYLASIYIDKILSSKSNSLSPTGSQNTRGKLLKLIIESSCLKHSFLVGKLQNTTLRQELAIVHGKAGDHAHALVVMVRELKDHALARTYCQKLHHHGEKKRAYLELLRIYVETYNEDEPDNLVEVLNDFVQEFDLLTILSLLPDGLPLSTISGVLLQATRIVVHKRRMATLAKGLSRRIHTDAILEQMDNNFGIAVEETSLCDECDQVIDGIESIGFCDGLVGHEACMR